MAKVHLDTTKISSWSDFHSTCKQQMGFPDFYGKNMNAWIDCLSYLTEDDGMPKFHLTKNELLHIEVADTDKFKSSQPEVFHALVECTASVNRRYLADGDIPRLSLIFL